MTSDAELVKRSQDGDTTAVGELYDRHQPHIYRYVWLRVGQSHLAEDITGEIFTRMVANLPQYRPGGTPFRAWLYRVAHNLIVDTYRRQNGRMTVPLHFADGMAEGTSEGMHLTDSLVDRRMTQARLEQALLQIDPVQREVVVLRFLMGLSLKEVAQTLDKTVAAVKSLQHRGLAALRSVMQQEAVK